MIVAAYTPGVTHRCLICENELEPQSGQPEWPHGAVVVRLYGMYGSTVFDPVMDSREYLEAFVCDACLIAKAKSSLLKHVVKTPREAHYAKTVWNPDHEQ